MTCTIRYNRPGRPEEAGLFIVANEAEFAAAKARLEASGYVIAADSFEPKPSAKTENGRAS